MIPLLLSLFLSPAHAGDRCDLLIEFSGFKSQKLSERSRLSAYNEYLNLFGLKDRHLPKHFDEFQNGPVLAMKFTSPEKKKMTVFLVESGHILGVFEGKNKWYCEKEK